VDFFSGLLGGMLNGRPNQPPPYLEARAHWCVTWFLQCRIAEQDRVERLQDFSPVVFRPTDRIRMLEIAVLWIGTINFKIHQEAAGGEITTWTDIVAGEQVDCRSGSCDLAGAQQPVRIERSSAGALNVWTTDL